MLTLGRTKSSRPQGPKVGPKGRKLEVGAQRAPRLQDLYNVLMVLVTLIDNIKRVVVGEVCDDL